VILSKPPRSPALSLALQGGGAHGAFTWGVLDALLEDGRVHFDAISGTSAGAMNAVVLAQGWLDGGHDGARASLDRFWTAVAGTMPLAATMPSADGQGLVLTPSFKRMLRWADYFSPDRLNPFDHNPVRDIISAQIDFERLRAHSPIKLFVAATHANSGRLRLFRLGEISVDAILASACLPHMNRAVVIDGEPYWDGGYAANPAVFPLIGECHAPDILLILLAPLRYKETPHSIDEIKERIVDFSFTTSFLREMQLVAQFRDSARTSGLGRGTLERRIAQVNFHLIDAQDFLSALAAETKLVANLQFFGMLKDLGRTRAREWLQLHYTDLGRRSSADLDQLF